MAHFQIQTSRNFNFCCSGREAASGES